MRQIRCIGLFPRYVFDGCVFEGVPLLWDHPYARKPWYLYDHEGD